ncbi:MAG: DUF2721 domain-containing protein [Catalinimonas sp.]
MELNLTTPALLFSTLSLLLLAYTNRFLTIATVIRSLQKSYRDNPSTRVFDQINVLRTRVHLIRNMQLLGILSLFFCVLCMFLLFETYVASAQWIFVASLLSMLGSLSLSGWEIMISCRALEIELGDLEELRPPARMKAEIE